MSKQIDITKLKIGDIILVSKGNKAIQQVQEALGYGASSVWTHCSGSIGGLDLIEATLPVSQVSNLQTAYVDKNLPIKVMRKTDWLVDTDRIKVALWWASMNNLPYDSISLLWFPFAALIGKWFLKTRNFFSSNKKLICSELLAMGLYRQGYALWGGRPADTIVPADFDDPKLFREIKDIWITA